MKSVDDSLFIVMQDRKIPEIPNPSRMGRYFPITSLCCHTSIATSHPRGEGVSLGKAFGYLFPFGRG